MIVASGRFIKMNRRLAGIKTSNSKGLLFCQPSLTFGKTLNSRNVLAFIILDRVDIWSTRIIKFRSRNPFVDFPLFSFSVVETRF